MALVLINDSVATFVQYAGATKEKRLDSLNRLPILRRYLSLIERTGLELPLATSQAHLNRTRHALEPTHSHANLFPSSYVTAAVPSLVNPVGALL